MRILQSFDTKTDAEELTAAVKKYGEGNVILVKKHRIKLIIPLLLVILSIFLLNLMLYVIYIHIPRFHGQYIQSFELWQTLYDR